MSSGNEVANQRVLLSGGSGMLGSALNRALVRRGAQVLKLVRHAPQAADELQWNPAASQPLADLRRIEGPTNGIAAVVHLSGASLTGRRWTPAYKREMWTSRVDTTRALSGILARLQRPPKVLIVASAVGIYGNRGDEVLDEASAPGAGFLADLCREWEGASKTAEDAEIRVVHARFGVVLGPKGGALDKMLPLFKLGLGGRLGSGGQWMSWVSQDDVVGAILFALDNERLRGAINVTSPEPVTNQAFTKALSHVLHRPAILPAPAFGLRLAFGEMADEALLASTRAIPTALAQAGYQFRHASLDSGLGAILGR